MTKSLEKTPQTPMQDLDVSRLRELAINTPSKQMDLATPFWPGTDGQVAILDVPNSELMELEPLRKESANPSLYLAAIICRALVKRGTNQRMFTDRDRDTVAAMGTSVLTPIFRQISEFYGLGADVRAAIEHAKKNS